MRGHVKPGGSLVLADLLLYEYMRPVAGSLQMPVANFLPDASAYRERLKAAGFTGVSIEDVTDATLGAFCKYLVGWPGLQRRNRAMSTGQSFVASIVTRAIATYFRTTFKTYLIASARKPVSAL